MRAPILGPVPCHDCGEMVGLYRHALRLASLWWSADGVDVHRCRARCHAAMTRGVCCYRTPGHGQAHRTRDAVGNHRAAMARRRAA